MTLTVQKKIGRFRNFEYCRDLGTDKAPPMTYDPFSGDLLPCMPQRMATHHSAQSGSNEPVAENLFKPAPGCQLLTCLDSPPASLLDRILKFFRRLSGRLDCGHPRSRLSLVRRLLIGLVACATLAVAQTPATPGVLSGVITDPQGALVPGAELKLENPHQPPLTATTDRLDPAGLAAYQVSLPSFTTGLPR